MKLSDSAGMRAADRRAIDERGIPSLRLMERAAEHLCRRAMEMCPPGRGCCIFCGSGNNGGDGVAAAYMLAQCGMPVSVWLTGAREKMTPDTAEMEKRLERTGVKLRRFDAAAAGEALKNSGLIIDAMLGIGLNSPLRGDILAAVRLINSAGLPVLAADIPTGVSADTGAIMGECVRADVTVTFSMAKPGHFVEPGCVCCGRTETAGIGIPADILAGAACALETADADAAALPARPKLSHKYDYGRLLILGGSVGYTGAVSMCTHAAARAGAGVVFTGVPRRIYDITAVKNDEAVVFPLPDGESGQLSPAAWPEIERRLAAASACVMGPGLGRSAGLTELVGRIVRRCAAPLLLDADALYAAGQDPGMLRGAPSAPVLTPHEGEFRLLGGELTGDRVGDARRFAEKYGCVLVLKGHHTVAAFPDGRAFVCPYGNPGMAKGGSGDVLAGIMGAMLCVLPAERAVPAAMYIHARAGDRCAEKFGEYSMLPTDMINCISEVTRQLIVR